MMTSPPPNHIPVEPTRITDYHIHVYYDPESRERAALLRQWVQERFQARMGSWHDVPVGPHVTAMYQIQFAPDQFSTLVPFVMMNRMGLTVLLHPQSGRPRDDHTINASWMGAVLPVKTDVLPEAG
jgi:aromatic ring-cleaving dioxygenase